MINSFFYSDFRQMRNYTFLFNNITFKQGVVYIPKQYEYFIYIQFTFIRRIKTQNWYVTQYEILEKSNCEK